MATADINKIRVEGERLILLEDVLGWDKARQMAVDHKARAFNSLFNLLSKPNSNDIEIIYEERRFEAFWHIIGTSEFEYQKKNRYQVPVSAEVVDLEALGQKFEIGVNRTFTLESLEHCRENYREELMIDANTDKPGDFSRYLGAPKRSILSTDELSADGTPIVYLETRAATLVREVLAKLVKPIKADLIMEENITISELCLYFYPVYTFEFFWKVKNKKATLAFDAVTTEVDFKAAKITDTLRKSFTNEDLFEFSKEIAQNIVPGGGLAVMLGKKALEMTKKK